VRKILATGTALENISFTPYPGMEEIAAKADEKAVSALLAEFDEAARAKDDDRLVTAATKGIEGLGVTLLAGINGVYNLFDKDGFHYCIYGGTKVLKSTDDNQVRGPIRVVKSVDVAAAMPPEAVSRIIGINMICDGYIATAAPGALVVLDRDLNIKSTWPSLEKRSTTISCWRSTLLPSKPMLDLNHCRSVR
jgi:hypothetical protein